MNSCGPSREGKPRESQQKNDRGLMRQHTKFFSRRTDFSVDPHRGSGRTNKGGRDHSRKNVEDQQPRMKGGEEIAREGSDRLIKMGEVQD